MSFSNSHILPRISSWFKILKGTEPYNKKNLEAAEQDSILALSILEKRLLTHTYLVGERLTLADLYVASQLVRGFEFVRHS
jgi:elongation factor 1-gamma